MQTTHPFRKEVTEPLWTEEIFTISKRLPRKPPMYFIKDINGEEIRASYYQHELQEIIKDTNASCWVEKVIMSRRNKKRELEHFVKWSAYSDTFCQWIPDSDLSTPT